MTGGARGLEQHEHRLRGGRRLRCVSAGEGTPMLLLHALGESSASWHLVLPALAAGHRVHAPDLPGFGGSDPLELPPGGEPDPPRFAAALSGLLDEVVSDAGDAVTLVASSFAGAVAVQLARQAPERVRRLVLVDSAGLGRYVHPVLRAVSVKGFGDAAVAAARRPLGAVQRARLRLPLLFARPELAPREWIAEQERLGTLPNHLRTTLAALRAQVTPFGQRRLVLDELAELDLPVTVVWGARDMVLPVTQASAAARRLRNGRLVVIPGCGHLPALEQPHSFVTALRADT